MGYRNNAKDYSLLLSVAPCSVTEGSAIKEDSTRAARELWLDSIWAENEEVVITDGGNNPGKKDGKAIS